MKHDDSIQGVLIQSVLRHCGGRVRFRLCRTVVALIPIIPIILGASSCRRETPPEPYVRSIELEALDVSCTEAWLRVRFTDSAAPRAFALKRDGQTILSALNSPPDTLLIDEGLLPNRTYGYKAYRFADSRLVDSTAQVTLTTMDTTSHNFTWQIDTLGDGGGSVLYDVAIINDTLAYAVGEIYKRDSLGNWDPLRYNLAKWNGQRWELKRVTVNFRGNLITPPLYGIYAFSGTDIWIAAGMAIHGNESNWVGHDVRALTGVDSLSFTKCWGVNSTDMYFVGLAGSIAHYDGVRWRRIESGTTLPIKDIYGARDPRTGRYEILCVAADPNIPGRSQVLAIESGTVREMATDPMWEPWGIWFIPQRRYIHAGDGLWEAYRVSGPWVRNTQLPALFKTSVRGQAINDVVVCGAFWLLAHWNGVRWQTYFPRTNNGGFVSVAIKGNMLVAVGGAGGGIDRKALLLIAHRR